jgi:hypothetical protein
VRGKEIKTYTPGPTIVLSVDNQPKTKLFKVETRHHARFNSCLVERDDGAREWFEATPVISWLKSAGWIGNAGNLAEIQQVLNLDEY